jgi:hypothetical protein
MLQTHVIPTHDVHTAGAQPLHIRRLGSARWLLIAAIAAVPACSDDPVSLGGAVAVDRSALSSYADVWEGYVEAHTFESGSDRVRLVLDQNGQGTITFGEAAPRPLPTDAENPFPDLPGGAAEIFTNQPLHEGIEYPIADALIEDERLRARTEPTNVYGEAACALQTPVESTCDEQQDGCFNSCAPRNVTRVNGRCVNNDDGTEISCQQWGLRVELCGSVCACTTTECFARNPGAPIVLDGALDEPGKNLVGSFDSDTLGNSYTVRLTRQH